ncbi:hypothetical protein BH23THE1_BH23THE1_33610 [soil metagenome]
MVFLYIYTSLIDTVCKNVEYGSTAFTDEYKAYDRLVGWLVGWKSMVSYTKERNPSIHSKYMQIV